MAWLRGYVAWNAIFHPGCGSQYTSLLSARLAAATGVRLSVERTNFKPNNAVAEGFFPMLMNERNFQRLL
ncbi:MAG: hypothetical protein FWH40_09215 [Coriobacteriia bacterium]|nr:hypothetical protein [Coriobacteriia bacterium]